jgi:hypothetical protein
MAQRRSWAETQNVKFVWLLFHPALTCWDKKDRNCYELPEIARNCY